ncbi:MAG TPA: DUF6483 family protein [Clostridia bacterium]|nr:DUF6483 family protein [Clostridia bacterium]
MIRRDYILRMLAEFFEALSRLRALKKGQLWREAHISVEHEFQRLLGCDAATAAKLTETELLARLIQGEPTQAVREKTLILTTLLKEAGDIAVAEGREGEGQNSYLKGLHLLLDVMAREGLADYPDFVPRVEVFVAALADSVLPLATQAMLMQHYEQTGQFAKGEDVLFSMLETEPDNPNLVNFGIAFYERLRGQSDTNLVAGNLPRPELEAGLAELQRKPLATS